MKSIECILSTCDKNDDLWIGFFEMLEKYWPGNTISFVSMSETKDIVINNLLLLAGNNAVADILHKKLNCIVAHLGCLDSVLCSRITAALGMT